MARAQSHCWKFRCADGIAYHSITHNILVALLFPSSCHCWVHQIIYTRTLIYTCILIKIELAENELVGYTLGKAEVLPGALNQFPGRSSSPSSAGSFGSSGGGFKKQPTSYYGHVTSIAVHKEYRKHGIAKKLMNKLHANMVNTYKIDTVNLHCRVGNTAAIKVSNLFNNLLIYIQSFNRFLMWIICRATTIYNVYYLISHVLFNLNVLSSCSCSCLYLAVVVFRDVSVSMCYYDKKLLWRWWRCLDDAAVGVDG